MSKKEKALLGLVAATTLVSAQSGVIKGVTTQNHTLLSHHSTNTNKRKYNKEEGSSSNSNFMIQNENIVNRDLGYADVQAPKDLNYQNDLQVQIGKISYQNNAVASNTNYIPQNEQPNNPLIMTQGDQLTVQVPFSLISKGGYNYSIKSVYLTANTKAYDLNNSNNAKDVTENLTFNPLNMGDLEVSYLGKMDNNLNSSSTGILNATFQNGTATWKQAYKLGLELNIELSNGQTITEPINTGVVKSTVMNDYQITPEIEQPTEVSGTSNEYNVPFTLYGLSQVGNENLGQGPYSYFKWAKSIQYKINTDIPAGSTITFNNLPDGCSYNPQTRILTMSTSAIMNSQSGQPTVTAQVKLEGNKKFVSTLSLVPVGVQLKDGAPENLDYVNNVTYNPSSTVQLSFVPTGTLGIKTETYASQYGPYTSEVDAYNENKVESFSKITGTLPVGVKAYNIQFLSGADYGFNNQAPQAGYTYCYYPSYSGSDLTSAQVADIVNRNGVKLYTADELESMIKEGKQLPELNVMFTSKDLPAGKIDTELNTGLTTPFNANNNVNQNAFVLTYIVPNYNGATAEQKEQFNELMKQNKGDGDSLIIGKDGNVKSLLQGAENGTFSPYSAYGNSNNGVDGINNQGTTIYPSVSITGTMGLQDAKVGAEGANKPQVVTITGIAPTATDGTLNPVTMPKGTQITVDMGSNFTLYGSITMNGKDCQYTREGNKLIITTPEDFTAKGAEDFPAIKIPVTYHLQNSKNITITATAPTDTFTTTINNKVYKLDNVTNIKTSPAPQVIQVVINKANDSVHSATEITNNKSTSTLTDTVSNKNNKDDNYMIYGEIPNNENGVPVEDGYQNTGSFDAVLNGISADGDVYILTKGNMNALDKQMLTSYNTEDTTKYVDNVKSTWTKYNGTMPKDAIGYVVFTNIKAGQSKSFTYGLTFDKYQSGSTIYSGFGYVNLDQNLQSTSNVVQMKQGTNDQPELQQQGRVRLEFEGVNGTVVPASIAGTDRPFENLNAGGSATPIPNNISVPVKMMKAMDIFNKNHLKVVKSTLNGNIVNYDAIASGNVEGLDLHGDNTIIIYLENQPQYTISSEMVTEDGKVLISPEQEAKGYPNATANVPSLKVPQGYELVKMEIGNNTITSLPTTIENHDVLIKYIVKKIPVTYNQKVVEELPNGQYKTLSKSQTYTLTYGANRPDVKADIPAGYKLIDTQDNGKDIKTLPSTITENTTITYVVKKNPVVVQTSYPDGKVVVNPDGKVTVPNGYQIANIVVILNNGKQLTYKNVNDIPAVYKNDIAKITYNLSVKMGDFEVRTVYPDGTVVKGSVYTEEGQVGTKVQKTSESNVPGYYVSSVTLDGKNYDIKTDSPVYTGAKQVLTYHLAKIPDNSIIQSIRVVNDKTGALVKWLQNDKVVADSYVGNKVNVSPATYDKDLYTLKSVEIDGVTYSPEDYAKHLPTTIDKNQQAIVYNLVQNQGSLVYETAYKSSGKIVENSKGTLQGFINQKVDGIKSDIPANYKLDSIVYNGKEISQADLSNIKFEKAQGIVIFYVSPMKSNITTEVMENGKVVNGTVNVQNGNVGSAHNPFKENIPQGYKIDNITVNGKVVLSQDLSKIDFTKDNQTVVYNISKIPTGTIAVGIRTVDGKTLVKPVPVEGEVGNTVKVNIPQVPAGDKVVETLLDGNKVSKISDVVDKGNKVYWIVVEQPVTVNVIMETADHKQIGSEITKTGIPGEAISGIEKEVPTGYHLVSKTINGTEMKGDLKDFPNSNSTIVYTIAKEETGSIVSQVIDEDGTPLSKQEVVNGTVGTVEKESIPSYDDKDYKIFKVLINGKETTKVPDTIVKGVTKIVYVAKKMNVEDTVKVVYKDGTPAMPTVTYTGMQGDAVHIVEPSMKGKLAGYEIVGLTVDNKKTDDLPNVFEGHNETIVFTIDKKETSAPAKPVVKPDIAGTMNIKVVTEDGKELESATHKGAIGTVFDSLKIPSGYELVKTTYDNKVTNEIPTHIEKGDNTIVYVVKKEEVTPAVKPSTPDKVKPSTPDKDNKPAVKPDEKPSTPSKDNKPSEPSKVTPSTPDKKTPVKPDVKPSEPSKETPAKPSTPAKPETPSKETPVKPDVKPSTPDTHHDVVINGKETVKVVTEDGTILSNSSSTEKIGDSIAKPQIPSGYKVVKVTSTVDGKEVKEVPTKVVKGDTVIVYTVVKETPAVKPVTPEHKNDKPAVKPSTPSKVTPVKPSKETPVKPDVKPSTPSKETPVKPDVKPVTPEHNNGKHEDVKPVTPQKHEGDSTHKEPSVKPAQPSKDTHKEPSVKPTTPNHKEDKPSVKPVTPINHNNVTPSKPVSRNDVTPAKPVVNNTPATSNKTDNTTVNNDTTANTTSGSSTSSDVINSLPHTGIAGEVVDNSAELAGLGAIVVALFGAFKFRKKNNKEDK